MLFQFKVQTTSKYKVNLNYTVCCLTKAELKYIVELQTTVLKVKAHTCFFIFNC